MWHVGVRSRRVLASGLLGLALLWSGGCQTQWPSLETQTRLWANQQLYDEVWQTLDRDYLEPTMNGQTRQGTSWQHSWENAWGQWRHRYDGWLVSDDDTYVAIDTMIASLGDDYTMFMRPRDMAEQSMQIDARLFGVGLELMKLSGRLTVVGVLPESPAKASPIRPGDVIVAIDDEPTVAMPIEDAASKIRGQEGTPVTLSLERAASNNAPLRQWQETLNRAEIKLHDLAILPLEASYGYLQIQSFIGETLPDELSQALAKLQKKRGLIIDLRGNAGGLLSNAVAVSDMFLDKGRIVSIEGRQNGRQDVMQTYDATSGQLFNGPIALLIDGGSASASEIVSAALHDHHRAVLIGERSFGKGLVQKVVPLAQDAGLNLTVSRYLTPRGQNIHHNGIAPDIAVFEPERSDGHFDVASSTQASTIPDLEAFKRRQLQHDPVVKAALIWLKQQKNPSPQEKTPEQTSPIN